MDNDKDAAALYMSTQLINLYPISIQKRILYRLLTDMNLTLSPKEIDDFERHQSKVGRAISEEDAYDCLSQDMKNKIRIVDNQLKKNNERCDLFES